MSEVDIGETIKSNIDYWKNLYFEEREKRNDAEEKLKITVAIITRGMYPEQNEGDNDFDKQFILIRRNKIRKNEEYFRCIIQCIEKEKIEIKGISVWEEYRILQALKDFMKELLEEK